MNDYRVTDHITDGIDVVITAIDQADAHQIFAKRNPKYKGIVEAILIRENVPATKDQEREALEKIKAIVATLGPRSYVGTALEGCLEDAEVNIENDFGDSMRARWQEAEHRFEEAAKETAAVRQELEAVRKHLQTAEDDANFYRDKVLDSDDLTDIAQLIDGHISQLRDMVKTSEVAILENAEHPETKIFTDAVRDRKNLTKDIEYYQALAQRVKHVRGQ